MFSFFRKDPLKKLEKKRAKLLEEAMLIQRSGDLREYSLKMTEIEIVEKEIEATRSGRSRS